MLIFWKKITRFTISQNCAKNRVRGKNKPSCLPFKKIIAIMSNNIWSTNESIELLYQTWTLALQFEFYDIIVSNFHLCMPRPFPIP